MMQFAICLMPFLIVPAAIADEPVKMQPVVPPTATKKHDAMPDDVRAKAQRAIDRGLAFLERQQTANGGWTEKFGPAVAAIAARSFTQDNAFGPKHPTVQRAVDYILKFQQTDGGIYERENNLANYQTSVALSLLANLDDDAHRARIARAQAFLTDLQYDTEESVDDHENWFGGAGYNKSKRPDLSNTQMMLEALHESGLPKDHPVYQRALKFVSRCQMNGETNDQNFAKDSTQGGFIYSPNNNGESKASQGLFELGKPLQSYGTMTYSGFKSMLYAGVERDDPRIIACLKWIRENYTLDANPGMPERKDDEGLYYYYHVFARALHVWGEPVIVDARGKEHHWRRELCEKLISLQRTDGSWENNASRWLEGDPNYVTALVVQSLQIALDADSKSTKPVSPVNTVRAVGVSGDEQ